MASVTVSRNPSTTGNTLTVNFTTDATNITDVQITKDGSSYTSAASFTSSSATFNVSSWQNGTYSNCYLKVIYTESGGPSSGGDDTPAIVLNNISNMTVNKGEQFNILYSTNVAAVKHEISWDGGSTFWDKTSEIVTSNTTNYKYTNQAETEHDSFNMAIRVTDAKGNTSIKRMSICSIKSSNNK